MAAGVWASYSEGYARASEPLRPLLYAVAFRLTKIPLSMYMAGQTKSSL